MIADEKRPPIEGSPWNTRRQPFARAVLSSCEPGSVIATKRRAAAFSPPSFAEARA